MLSVCPSEGLVRMVRSNQPLILSSKILAQGQRFKGMGQTKESGAFKDVSFFRSLWL